MSYNHLVADGSPITAPHIDAQWYLPIVDRILEPQTVADFVSFAFGSPLPEGTRPPSLPTLQEDDGKVLVSIGDEKDPSRMTMVGKNIHALKNRLWEGIVPLSDQRWEEEGLHLEENFDQAYQHLSAVVAVFEYLNADEVQEALRETFNLIYAHWEGLDDELNRKRSEKGGNDTIGVVKLGEMWTAYMESKYKVMTNRAHQWVTRHVDELRAPILQGLLDHDSDFEDFGLMIPDSKQWELTNALHLLLEIGVRADYTILMPMVGYKGIPTSVTDSYGPQMYSENLTVRGEAYSQHVKSLSHRIMFQKMIENIDKDTDRPEQTSGEEYYESALEQVDAQIEARNHLRGDGWGEDFQEPWISRFMHLIQEEEGEHGNDDDGYSPNDSGFVVYRLTYEQSEAEWADFLQVLQTHIFDWGSGQTGTELVKPYLKLHWIDGQAIGLAEGDIEGAKEHFNQNFYSDSHDSSERFKASKLNTASTNKTEPPPQHQPRIPITPLQTAFLAIDAASFTSYTTPNTTNPISNHDHDHSTPRTTHPFLLAIDPTFSSHEGAYRPDESPGYNGIVRVTGRLVWGDLFATLATQSATLEEIWPLAMHHPDQVYVGPVIPLQLCGWGAERPLPWWVLRALVWESLGALRPETWRGALLVVGLGGVGYVVVARRWARRGGVRLR
ncbi:hypothetical protein BJY04DRAFT_219747 [Aspergillus karnatakaensis]|uniref:uncharacterized protein n=1 Tax=Aspergillus karnatakaensis TaxID=1810916 RepID=UPI003CCDFEDA